MPEWEGAQVPVPDGVHPLFLTGSSQEEFSLDSCTVEDPYRMVNRADLLKSIQFKGKISDFYIVQKHIEKYKGGDEILICLDDDEIYGQNFFMCISEAEATRVIAEEEAKAALRPKPKKPKDGDEEGAAGGADEDSDDYEEEPYVPPVSKPWVSLGSEAEIEEEAVIPTRERFVMQMVRKRREFGAAYRFSDRDAGEDPNITQNDCRQYKDPNFELRRKEMSIGVQAVPSESDAKCQTTWFRPVNKALQYDYITIDKRKAFDISDSEAMSDFLRKVGPLMEEALQQNETVDIFADDFADLADDETSLGNKADSELKELQSYYHLSYCAGRLLTFIQWQSKAVVATAGARHITFEERVNTAGKVHTGYILLWNFSDPINPQFVLEAPGDVHCFRFCPTNSDVVIGGLESGQVALWNLADARTAAREAKALADETHAEGETNTITAKATVLTNVDVSHKKAVKDLVWLPTTLDVTEKGKFKREESAKDADVNMFLSVAGDGVVLFWDLRKSVEPPPDEQKKEELPPGKHKKPDGWGPTAKMQLLNPDGGYELSPVQTRLDVPDDPAGACRLYMVTEEGEFINVELLAPAVENFIKGVKSVIPAHTSPCVALQRSPFLPHHYVSVGDWTFNLWMEGVASPLFTSPFCTCLYTCGAWSPSRPAVLFIARVDGNIDIWDLNDRSHEPSMTVAATPGAITSMEFHMTSASRQLLAVGDDQGTVHVMEVPRNLRRAVANEKQFATNFFEREQKRVEYVRRRKEQAADEKDAPKDDAPPPPKDDAKEGETPEDKLEAAFRVFEEQFKEEMGLNPPAEAPAEADEA